ncbi:DNA repair protein RecN [Vagococcus sp. BWB3-3]|uniref:DNA repair protein RecN n=1 Tax=Vagococcus allomyrinae TaxID=2794353 RepID=A0A940PAN2_9ENTE|nr:DNA repair protein RecN [Vagococcus allomyrinae]MBP1041514.1 DNA repair protein RecN [Vagococcus allomyrinae]
MLQELSIQNFAIISALDVSFGEGMTVLTGETGAGKSIIIDAVGLLVGGRGSTDYIRQGASKCVLEGQFSVVSDSPLVALLNDLAVDFEDDTVIISREISKSGKNACRVNGRLINTTTLRDIGSYLVDIHGQNEHQELMHAETHLGLLDQYGQQQIKALKSRYEAAYARYRETLAKVRNKQKHEKEFAQRIDMLQFQCEEIEAAELKVGEEAQLMEERHRLNNFQKIADGLTNSYEALTGGEVSSLDQIGFAMNELIEIEGIDSEYLEVSEAVKSSYYQLQEAVSGVSRMIDTLEMDETRIDEVEFRLDTIRQLKRKYGESEEQILAYFADISSELMESIEGENQSEKLETKLSEQEKTVKGLADELTILRSEIAKDLEAAIVKQLKELYMEKTVFEVKIEKELSFNETGQDKVEFFITTNPGEPLKPLVKVVSGGELSRIMLALKTIFSQTYGVTSIVFDEVDTGVSGRVAQAIANKIHQVAERSQVLCITHLPQVAAAADTQYFIEKQVKNKRTETFLKRLSEEERVLEVARMLSGDAITPLTKEHARELLALARRN